MSIGGVFAMLQADREALEVDLERRTSNFMTFLKTDLVDDYTRDNNEVLQTIRKAVDENGLDAELLEQFRSETVDSDLVFSSIVIVPRVTEDDTSALSAAMERNNGKSFSIRPNTWGDSSIRAEYKPSTHYPVIDFVSQRENIDFTGVDMVTSKADVAAFDAALSKGRTFAMGMVDENGSLTFIHFMPLPAGFSHPNLPDEICEGFVGILTDTSLGTLSEFFPLSMEGINTYFVSSPRAPRRNQPVEDDPLDPAALISASVFDEHQMASNAFIDMGGTHWNIVSAPRAQLYTLHKTNRPQYVFMIVLALTLLAGLATLTAQTRAQRIDRLIRQRTSELSNANEDLAREISERKKTELALIQSQELYELLSSNVTDVIWTTDLETNLNYISPSVKHLRGFTPEECRQQPLDQILTPESFASILPLIGEAVERVHEGEVDPPPSYTLELDLTCHDGGVVRTETTASVLLNAEKQVVGFLGVTRDIEARKHAEDETATLESQLRQSQKMEAVGTLAGGIAHDFNNLLTGILGYANLLKLQSKEKSSTYEAADVIEKAAERAADLTKQLLGFARQGKLQNSAVDLHDMIRESVALLRRTIDKSINISQRMDAERPEVMGDPSQLQLVILNLAVNARDAMPDGGDLTIETNCIDIAPGAHSDLAPGSYVRLRVTDTGAGISPEVCERIFEPFFTTKPTGEGTGLGLATVYGIVKNHDGTVTVDSVVGRGSTFEVLLPIAVQEAVTDASTDIETPVHGRGKILVVEDEEVVRKLAKEILGWLGYETVTVCDGLEAVEYYGGNNDDIDLALIDLNMPRMGGRECYQRMKEINPNLRAVLSTGYSRDGAAQEILDDGVQGFVQKPFQASQLSEAIALAMK